MLSLKVSGVVRKKKVEVSNGERKGMKAIGCSKVTSSPKRQAGMNICT